MIPISKVTLGVEEETEVLDAIRSGMLAQGRRVEQFERRFGELFGGGHVVAVNNGTTALVASLQALDLQPGDEVLTSPFTFAATLNAILEAGATARFADIREDDFTVDPESVRARLTSATKVLLPVHLYGQMADMTALTPLAVDNGLEVVEDAAQAHGATCDGRYPGASSAFATYSLYATKNITTGEGGLVVTHDDELADHLRVSRNQGMRSRYDYEMAGHNYRLTDVAAAIGLPQLERYEETVAARRRNAARLSEGLRDVPGLILPIVQAGRTHVWHQYTVRVTEEAAVSRDGLVAKLADSGIGAGIYYPRLVFDYAAYRENPRVRIDSVPVAARIVDQVVSLPVHTALTASDVDEVIDGVRTAMGVS